MRVHLDLDHLRNVAVGHSIEAIEQRRVQLNFGNEFVHSKWKRWQYFDAVALLTKMNPFSPMIFVMGNWSLCVVSC